MPQIGSVGQELDELLLMEANGSVTSIYGLAVPWAGLNTVLWASAGYKPDVLKHSMWPLWWNFNLICFEICPGDLWNTLLGMSGWVMEA